MTDETPLEPAFPSDAQEAEVKAYDFRQPGGIDHSITRQMEAWLTSTCPQLDERIAQYMAQPIPFAAGEIGLRRAGDIIEKLPEVTFAWFIKLGAEKTPTAMILSRQLTLALVGGMLGEEYDALPDDRALTAVESSLAELFIQEIMAATQEGFTGEEPLILEYDRVDAKPHRSRVFPADDNLAIVRLSLSASFGEHTIEWLIPHDALETTFPAHEASGQTEEDKRRLVELVKQIPIQLEAHLGETEMHISEMTNLAPGDVVVLNQRLIDPLSVCIQQHGVFRGWAGRIGKNQALYVETSAKEE